MTDYNNLLFFFKALSPLDALNSLSLQASLLLTTKSERYDPEQLLIEFESALTDNHFDWVSQALATEFTPLRDSLDINFEHLIMVTDGFMRYPSESPPSLLKEKAVLRSVLRELDYSGGDLSIDDILNLDEFKTISFDLKVHYLKCFKAQKLLVPDVVYYTKDIIHRFLNIPIPLSSAPENLEDFVVSTLANSNENDGWYDTIELNNRINEAFSINTDLFDLRYMNWGTPMKFLKHDRNDYTLGYIALA